MSKKSKVARPELDDRNAFAGASGKEYFVEPPELLGIDRKRAFDKALTKAAFGQDAKSMIRAIVNMKEAFNKMQLTDVGHQITTMLSTASDIHNRSDATLEACAIFINTEKEDRTKAPTDAEVAEKIKDWNDAGLSYAFFVKCAGTFSATLRALYESSSPSSPAQTPSPKPSKGRSLTSST